MLYSLFPIQSLTKRHLYSASSSPFFKFFFLERNIYALYIQYIVLLCFHNHTYMGLYGTWGLTHGREGDGWKYMQHDFMFNLNRNKVVEFECFDTEVANLHFISE